MELTMWRTTCLHPIQIGPSRFPVIFKINQSIECMCTLMAIKCCRPISVSRRAGILFSKKSGNPDVGLSMGVPGDNATPFPSSGGENAKPENGVFY